MPTTDRIGKRRAWDILEKLALPADGDLTDGSKFLWGLWVPKLADRVPDVIGNGIVRASLSARGDVHGASVAFTRVDASVCVVRLFRDERGQLVREIREG